MTFARTLLRPGRWLALALGLAVFVAARLAFDVLAPPPALPAAPPPAPRERSAPDVLAALQDRVRARPNDSAAYAQLGLAFLQRARTTADPGDYTRAEAALRAALEHDPRNTDALVGLGALALARHQFAEAATWGEQALALNPYSAAAYGVLVDAHVERGAYPEALAALAAMMRLRPDIASFSRVAYLRELHGDVPGALAAMEEAVASGAPGSEAQQWAQVQLGHLHFNRGDFAQAERAYQAALRSDPAYPYARAGLARVAAAEGRPADAIALYREVLAQLPLPEFAIALGELYEAQGDTVHAQAQYDLVRAIQQLNASAGVVVDLELALFNAEHGSDPAAALAQARAAYAARPTVYAADTLAWALYRTGDYAAARPYTTEALRLGTPDARMQYHAGQIAYAAGDRAAARAHLQTALALNPAFSPLYAPLARALLAKLEAEK